MIIAARSLPSASTGSPAMRNRCSGSGSPARRASRASRRTRRPGLWTTTTATTGGASGASVSTEVRGYRPTSEGPRHAVVTLAGACACPRPAASLRYRPRRMSNSRRVAATIIAGDRAGRCQTPPPCRGASSSARPAGRGGDRRPRGTRLRRRVRGRQRHLADARDLGRARRRAALRAVAPARVPAARGRHRGGGGRSAGTGCRTSCRSLLGGGDARGCSTAWSGAHRRAGIGRAAGRGARPSRRRSSSPRRRASTTSTGCSASSPGGRCSSATGRAPRPVAARRVHRAAWCGGLLLGLAAASRLAYAPLGLVVVLLGPGRVAAGARARASPRRSWPSSLAIGYVPALRFAGDLSFLTAERPTGQGVVGVLGRAVLKGGDLLGLVGTVVAVVVVVLVVRSARAQRRPAAGEWWLLVVVGVQLARLAVDPGRAVVPPAGARRPARVGGPTRRCRRR